MGCPQVSLITYETSPVWHPQQESNPYQQYRKLLFYPLNYGGVPAYFIIYGI